MYQYELFIPSNFRDMIQAAQTSFTIYYGGCTTYNAEGAWRDANNLPNYENTTVIMALSETDDDAPIQSQAKFVADYCNQEAVLWTKKKAEVNYVRRS
jgi:hypothetical protein